MLNPARTDEPATRRPGNAWSSTATLMSGSLRATIVFPLGIVLSSLALVVAIGSDVEAHWGGINPGRWARLIADVIIQSWPAQKSRP